MSASTFTLNKDIFNPSLYKLVRSIWFDGQPDDAIIPTPVAMKRWWMGSPEERLEFDSRCRANFVHALEAIGPDKFPDPTAEPFLKEIQEAVQKNPENNGSEAAWTALSIVLLLDQMPRNIYRTNDTLPMVYNHYDKMSQSLLEALMSKDSPIIRPDLHPQWRLSSVHRIWFYLPWMHSESLEMHKKIDGIQKELRDELSKMEGTEEAVKYIELGIGAEQKHLDLIEKFGRYPHRNRCLAREMTAEEKKYIEDGGDTFGVSQVD
ncbi:hypothetical protein K469DRAFT_730513 [Zopfia rhizophila CBS 207.26]|uniref:DUF924-domain-containing protein n=1 Tax=Zopfia rhizophila CBS 207.26 TaxID=1314779 RepID=A0A6A6DPV1_9PEZI|nr:hypothetical protein K469DRAFT_730513 [Zopfia rhizophila CBS 207.26]